MSRERVSSVVN